MNFTLHKHNIPQVKKVLQDVKGKAVCVNDVSLSGVVSIDITESELYDYEPIPEENENGGRRERIDLTFSFQGGSAKYSFEPKQDHCEISFETEDLWIINIQPLEKYLEREISNMQFELDWMKKEEQKVGIDNG